MWTSVRWSPTAEDVQPESALRSEQVMSEERTRPGSPQGIPGALTNQPPRGNVP